jgi:hypothetical protein
VYLFCALSSRFGVMPVPDRADVRDEIKPTAELLLVISGLFRSHITAKRDTIF